MHGAREVFTGSLRGFPQSVPCEPPVPTEQTVACGPAVVLVTAEPDERYSVQCRRGLALSPQGWRPRGGSLIVLLDRPGADLLHLARLPLRGPGVDRPARAVFPAANASGVGDTALGRRGLLGALGFQSELVLDSIECVAGVIRRRPAEFWDESAIAVV
jgi:hypothetical protein